MIRFGVAALTIGALALAFGIGVRSATSWSPGDVFVGMDNEFLGDPSGEITGVPTPSQYPFFDRLMTPKGVITLTNPASYTTGCAIDPTVPDGDLWSTGFWDRSVTRISSLDPHPVVSTFDLSADIGLPAGDPCPYSDDPRTCDGATVQLVFARDGTFYVGTAFGKANVYHYNKSGTMLDEYDVDTTGFRGAEFLDLGEDQRTLYYTGLDDAGETPPVIHVYDLQTHTQLPSIPLTGVSGTRLSTHVFAFRLLPPGDGTGGFIVATDLHVYQVDASGQVVRDFLDTPDFRRQMGDDADFTLFIDANLSNDGRYLWSAAYAQVEDDGVDVNGDPLTDANGTTLKHVVVPTKLFKFHIPTGTLQGATDVGSVGDRRTANTLCINREYIASVEQPDCQLNPGDYRCSPPPNCSLPGSDSNPLCAVPGMPTISYPNPGGSTVVTGQAGGSANLQVLADLFAGDGEQPASPGPLGYAASPLPAGVSINPNSGLISGTIASNGEFNVVVTVTDQSNGRSATAPFTWKVGNSFPAIAAVPGQTSPLGVPIAPVTLSATDVDATDVVLFSQSFGTVPLTGLMIQAINGRSARIIGTPALPSGYPCPSGICGNFPVTVHASDGHAPEDPSQTTTFTWTITNQAPTAPVLTSPPASLNIHIGTLLSLNVTSSDPNGDPVNYSLQITPPSPGVIPGLVVSSGGLISGGPPVLGTYLMTVIADDLHGGISSTLLTVNVTNQAPTPPVLVSSPLSLNVHIGAAAVFQVLSIDSDNDPISYSLAVTPPIPGMSISPTGVVTGTPPAMGIYQVNVFAADTHGGVSSTIFVLNVGNQPPTAPVLVSPPSSLNVHIGAAASFSVHSVDPDGDAIAYSLSSVTPPIPGLSISPAGVVTGAPPSALASYQVTVFVADPYGGTNSATFTLNVTNHAPSVPAVTSGSLAIHAGTAASVQVTSTDPDAGDVVHYSLVVTPPPGVVGSNLSISPTGLISGTPPAVGAYQLQVTVDDGLPGGTSTQTFTLIVANQPPTAPVLQSPPSSLNIHIGSAAAVQVRSIDPDGDAITYTLQVTSPSGVLSSNLSISSGGLITGTPPAVGAYLMTVTASDAFGGTASAAFTLVVSSNQAPSCSVATASPALLWPPDHKFVSIAINGLTDPDGDALTIRITRILQDEPTFGPGDDGAGNTRTDGRIVGGSQAQVRAERSGEGDGRVYVIRFTATDPSGATCSGTVTVGVPHDRGHGGVAIDSLVRYDSLVAGGPPLRGPEFNLAPVYTNQGRKSTKVGTAVSLSTTAIDLNLDPLVYSALGLPPGLTMNATSGKITGSPITAGTYNVTLTASDPFGGSGSAAFIWVVITNRPPVAVTDAVTISKGKSVTISVLANDSDPDGDSLTLVSVQGARGTATVSGSKVNYKPSSSSFTGIDQFTYTVSDGRGATATGTIRVEVVNHNDNDGCDHDRRRNGHHDGDGDDHDRYSHSKH